MSKKRNRDYRSRMHARSCPYASENSSQIFSIRNSRIFKEKKFAYDINISMEIDISGVVAITWIQ